MAEETTAAIPERVGRYLVQDVIGRGGFATVYRATDERLGSAVAIKVLAEEHSINPEARERFILEGQRLRRLGGPHVVELYDLGDTEQAQPYLVMQRADRGDLGARVAVARTRGYRPTYDDGLKLAQTLDSALSSLHRQELAHGDLAPNILLLASLDQEDDRLTEEELRQHLFPEPGPGSAGKPAGLIAGDEELLLADLGLSQDLAKVTGLTVAVGSAGFVPPEQRAGAAVGRGADIWAATALLVWLATGEPPDDAGGWRDQFLAAGWPAGLLPALERGLAGDAAQRQPTIHAWLDEVAQPSRAPLPAPPPLPTAPLATGETPLLNTGQLPPLAPEHTATSPPGAVAPKALPAPGAFPARQRRRWPAVVIAALVGLAAGGAAGAIAGDALDSDSSTAEGVSASIDGPEAVAVGEQVTFTAEIEGATAFVWVAPDGTFHSEPTLSFAPTTEGSLTIRLYATDGQGRTTEATHSARASDG